MEELVTLKLGRYEALRDKARRVGRLEIENEELKKDLTIARKQLEELQQPNEKRLYEYKLKNEEEKHVGMIVKPIEGLKLRRGKHYAKGGVTTKEEVTELKRSKKNK